MHDKESTPRSSSPDSAWEALCRRCGECCFEKWVDGSGRIFFTGVACRHLDIVTRECRVYDKRLEVGEGCVRLTPESVGRLRWLPESCGYVVQARSADPKTGPGKPGRSPRRRGRK